MELSSNHRKGSVVGSALLIAGSCVGAGMLGLPANSAMAGFGPSLFLFIATWLFMMTTGLLLLEVNLSFDREVNIVSMAGYTLGRLGSAAAWVLFLFLFYSLMVSFISGSGELFCDFVEEVGGVTLSHAMGSMMCTALFTVCIYFGAYTVDHFNRLLMGGMIITYLLLLTFAAPHITLSRLQHVDIGNAFWVAPLMVISFGYHNLVPSLTHYLRGDGASLKRAIIYGSALPLVAYLLWECVILGVIPTSAFAEGHDHMVTHILRGVAASSAVVTVAQFFAFFAIVTTLLGVGLSLVDFLADGLSIRKGAIGRASLCLLALAPPLCLSLYSPHLFVSALKYAGGFGAVLLFGVLPAAMAWKGRSHWNHRCVGGGKATLVAVMLFALAIFAIQLLNAVHFHR